jgi:outer membrane protease
MIEEQENMNPNSSLELADVIRENYHYQVDQNVKRTLLKESLLKISLDKDFQHIFEDHQNARRE